MAGLLDGMAPGDGQLAEHAPGLLDPFTVAALRRRMAVLPFGGRQPGAMTKVAERYLPHVLGNIATLPQRAVEGSANYRATGQYDPVFLEAALTPMVGAMPFAPKGAVGAMGGKPPRPPLPMDEASRMARARELDYADDQFYRGEATGKRPTEFPGGGDFSRDRDTALGFAKRGGADAPAEYRLNLQNSFVLAKPVTAESYGRIVASLRSTDPTLANQMVDMIAPGRDVDWFLGFAKHNPGTTVVGNGAVVHQIIDRGSRDPVGAFVRAGYDAIDSGRDVRKLTGDGIRSKDAVFDPAKRHLQDILAAAPLGMTALGAATDPNRE